VVPLLFAVCGLRLVPLLIAVRGYRVVSLFFKLIFAHGGPLASLPPTALLKCDARLHSLCQNLKYPASAGLTVGDTVRDTYNLTASSGAGLPVCEVVDAQRLL
jgi:hypothetical protein